MTGSNLLMGANSPLPATFAGGKRVFCTTARHFPDKIWLIRPTTRVRASHLVLVDNWYVTVEINIDCRGKPVV
jgi:hypothetical protein